MKNILKHFFCRRGKFTPPYFWVTLLLCIVVAMLIMKLAGARHVSDTLVLGTLGFVAVWLAVYTWYDARRVDAQPDFWRKGTSPQNTDTGGQV
mgnify:CR=1 FL=1